MPKPFRFALVLCCDFTIVGAARAAESTPAGAPPNANRDVGSQNEKDWIDNRWNRTDVGQFLSSLLDTPSGSVAKGICR